MLCRPTNVAAAICQALEPVSSHFGDGTNILSTSFGCNQTRAFLNRAPHWRMRNAQPVGAALRQEPCLDQNRRRLRMRDGFYEVESYENSAPDAARCRGGAGPLPRIAAIAAVGDRGLRAVADVSRRRLGGRDGYAAFALRQSRERRELAGRGRSRSQPGRFVSGDDYRSLGQLARSAPGIF